MNTVDPITDMEKVNEIIDHLKENDIPRNYLMFTLGVNSALRISDLLGLQVKDVVDENFNIKENIYLREGKTGKEKTYSLSNGAKEAIRYYLDKNNVELDDYLFESQNTDKPINRTWAWELIKKWTDIDGLTGNYGTHSLRKTWGYHALRTYNAPLEMIQAKLNHSSPAVTRRYIGIEKEEISELERKVSFGD